MCFPKFIHKIKTFFSRRRERPIPDVSEEKKVGSDGERYVVDELYKRLPSCKIKKNVVVHTREGDAEIDCVVLYENKIFAIEIKNWKGRIIERGNEFIQQKTDKWTDKEYESSHKSPFKQLKRSIYLFKKHLYNGKAWINPIVFFCNAYNVFVCSEDVWFDEIADMVRYIAECGDRSNPLEANACFNKFVPADRVYRGENFLNCVLCNESVTFCVGNKTFTRKDIDCIDIKRHAFYDKIVLHLKNGYTQSIEQENAKIKCYENLKVSEYALCKIDRIELGKPLIK